MKKPLVIVICLLILSPFYHSPVSAQGGDVPTIEYNKVFTQTPASPGEQVFVQFNGNEGDLVYVLADYTDFVIADIEIDLRDSVGRSVGFRDEYSLEPFILAELPATALYTVVVTPEEAEEVSILVGQTDYLENGASATIIADGFQAIFGVQAEQTGSYHLVFERTDGELATDFTLVTFSEIFTENIINVRGTDIARWEAWIDLQAGQRYIAFLDQNIFRDRGTTATVEVFLEPFQ